MKGFFDESEQFLTALRVEEEEEEDENDDDNSSDNNDKNGCFNWMMKDRTSTVGTYVRACQNTHVLISLKYFTIFFNIYAFIDIHMTTFIYLRIKQFYVYFCTSELIFCV